MTERDLEKNWAHETDAALPRVLLWKIRDETTGGQPDHEVCWNGHTTKLEFKLLKGNDTIHDKWEDQRQLITLCRYEETTQRAWVVAWRVVGQRRGENHETVIYRPSALLHGATPKLGMRYHGLTNEILPELWKPGGARFEGFNHQAVIDLIKMTHS